MYARDHNPPHFHAQYQDQEAMISIRDGAVIEGGLPRQLIRHAQEWRLLHEAELMANWEVLASGVGQTNRIAPLS